MDEFAMRHLRAWLDRCIYDEDRERVESAMLRLVADDPTVIDLGWPTVRDLAETFTAH